MKKKKNESDEFYLEVRRENIEALIDMGFFKKRKKEFDEKVDKHNVNIKRKLKHD